jgi:hypothetical protein
MKPFTKDNGMKLLNPQVKSKIKNKRSWKEHFEAGRGIKFPKANNKRIRL